MQAAWIMAIGALGWSAAEPFYQKPGKWDTLQLQIVAIIGERMGNRDLSKAANALVPDQPWLPQFRRLLSTKFDTHLRLAYNEKAWAICKQFWPVRLEAQDVALSRPKQGFESPTGYQPRLNRALATKNSRESFEDSVVKVQQSTLPLSLER
jgi:hypothetical protein